MSPPDEPADGAPDERHDRLERAIEERERALAAKHPEPHEPPVNLAAGGYGGGPRTTRAAREEAERDEEE